MTEIDGQKLEQQLNTQPVGDPFQTFVKEQMDKVVEICQHPHPLFQPTRVTEVEIDPKNQHAALILFEQIDVDAFAGDQFRYSLWTIIAEQTAQRIYEDHAYIRETINMLTGSRGRDCSLYGLSLKEGQVSVQNAAGQTLNFQMKGN